MRCAKFLLLFSFAMAAEANAPLPGPRLEDEAGSAAEQNALRCQLAGLLTELERVQAEQRELQRRYEQVDANSRKKTAKVQRVEAMLKEKLDEIERLEAELKKALEERKRIGERLRRFNPGGLEPQVPSRRIKHPAPEIDDMPPLGPLAVEESEALVVLT